MSNQEKGGLRIAPNLSLPLDAITETFALLAVRRAGKSNAAVVMAEEMYDNGLPWVAVDPKGDWWGIRAAGDGKAPGLAVLVFGGLHGDVPLEPTAGKLVADLIVEQRITCVLDVSEMSKADMRRFLTDFALRLYQRNTEPLHVFCEEADEYIPQRVMGPDATLVGAFEKLIKRGGFRGVGVTLITQRSASLNKDVLTQVGTLIPMRTPSPQDRKAILAWVDVHDTGKELVEDLPSLDSGEAYVFSPQWLGSLTKIKFRRRRTFDSGATPKIGQKVRPPASLADVDLAQIKEAMAETIEKQRAEDPKVLRKRIKELERELAAKPAPAETVVERVEIPVLSEGGAQALRHMQEQWSAAAQEMGDHVRKVFEAISAFEPPKSRRDGRAVPTVPRSVINTPKPVSAGPTQRALAAGDADVPPARLKLLEALVSLESIGVHAAPRNQVALFAGVSPKSSGYANNLGAMNTAGLITYPSKGVVQITDAGRSCVGEMPPPASTEDLHAQIRGLLADARWRILEPLIGAYPDALSRDDLAELAGVSAASSGYANNLGALRSLGLLDYPMPGLVSATDVLFLGASS